MVLPVSFANPKYNNIKSIIINSIKNLEKNRAEMLFFDVSSTKMFMQFFDDIIKNYEFPIKIITKSVLREEYMEAYFPFINIMKEEYLANNSCFSKVKGYYYNKSAFEDYFLDRVTEKEEDILLEEIEYTADELIKSMLNYYTAIGKDNMIVITVNGIENCGESTFKFIESLCISKLKCKILFIFSFTQRNDFALEEEKENWYHFVESIKEKNSIISIKFDKDIIVEEEKKVEEYDIEKLIELEIRNFNFFALNEAKTQMEKIYNKIVKDTLPISEEYYFMLLKYLGDTWFYLKDKDTDAALYYYNIMLDYAIDKQNKKMVAETYKRLGKIYFDKNNKEFALKYIRQGLKIAEELNDEVMVMKLKYCEFEIAHIVINYEFKKLMDMFYEIERLATKLKADMILSKIYGIIVTDNKALITYEEKMNYCLKGIRIAKKKKNLYKLASLYHDLGIIYSMAGDNINAFINYKKSERLKVRIGNKQEIARIFNGTGYGYFVAEDYNKAMIYYNKGLKCLNEIKNYEEMGLSFYNIALLCLFSGGYGYSCYLLEKILEILKILNIRTLPFHTIFGIYSLIGISYIKMGNTLRAYDNLEQANNNIMKDNLEDYFFYLVLNSLIAKQERRYLDAEEYLNKIEEIKDVQCIQLFLPRYYYEYGLLLKESKDFKRAENIFNEGISYCESRGFNFSKKMIIEELRNMDVINFSLAKPEIKITKFNADLVISSLKQEIVINRLYRKIDEVNYLNSLQRRLLELKNSIDYMVKEIGEFINELFMVEDIFIFGYEYGEMHVLYSKKQEYDKKRINGILKYLMTLKKEVFYEDIDKESQEIKQLLEGYSSLISIPLFNEEEIMGEILIANSKKDLSLNKDDFRLLSISGKQIKTALINKQLKDKLETRSLEIEKKNMELTATIEELNLTQQKLVEAEKMASLGNLVAGVAHEINTPVGVSLTASSFVVEKSKKMKEIFNTGMLKKVELEKFLNNVEESNRIITSNLERAGELILSFKQIAVDQTTEDMRVFNVEKYLQEVLLSLRPKLKLSKLRIEIKCNEDIEINSYPGAFSQIINNLVMNSLLHAFDKGEEGIISFFINTEGNRLFVEYKDNGRGMVEETRKRIFEPFFTTKRNQGGTGLGMSIIYNLIKQKLLGEITVKSEPGKGSCFNFDFPIEKVRNYKG